MKKKAFISVNVLSLVALMVAAAVPALGQTGPYAFAHPAFERVWERTDSLVADGTVARTWFWGPQPGEPRLEAWKEAPNGQRLVQYFDKSRMELNDPSADPNSAFFVTNGLLTVELISGQLQIGVSQFQDRFPANIAMSGDPGDETTPTYASFANVSNTNLGNHYADDRRGQKITATIDREGTVGNDPSKSSVPNTDIVYYEPITHHNIPNAFWTFLNQVGKVREAGLTVDRPLITPWFYASGLPISEPYWTRSLVRGQVIDVLIQAFERRVLTYTPSNGPGFQVEMGNIGQHYYNWRYRFAGLPAPGTGTPFNTPSPGETVVIPTPIVGTPVGGTPPAEHPTATPTLPAPMQTASAFVPPRTPTRTPTPTATLPAPMQTASAFVPPRTATPTPGFNTAVPAP
jgi:hypothetical protein